MKSIFKILLWVVVIVLAGLMVIESALHLYNGLNKYDEIQDYYKVAQNDRFNFN